MFRSLRTAGIHTRWTTSKVVVGSTFITSMEQGFELIRNDCDGDGDDDAGNDDDDAIMMVVIFTDIFVVLYKRRERPYHFQSKKRKGSQAKTKMLGSQAKTTFFMS